MPEDLETVFERTLPGEWTREDLVRDYRYLTPYYFHSDGGWRSRMETKGIGEVLGEIFGTERSGRWTLRGWHGSGLSTVLDMRLNNMDLGLAGKTVLLPFKKIWEALESVDLDPWKRYELEKVEDDNHLIMVGMSSILDGRERWTRRS